MKFIIDADSPRSLVRILNQLGHHAVHVRDLMGSASDDEIFKYANANHCIIVTRDLGFAEMFLRDRGYGLILIRLPYYFIVDKITKVFDKFMKESISKNFINSITVLELGRYRYKKL